MDARADSLRVLMVEDSPADTELILRALRDLGRPFEHLRVADEARLRESLAEFAPDVILSDFLMPGFSGREALRIARELAPDTPFLFVSGTIGLESTIEAVQHGAVDYVLKDNLRRLSPAVERALQLAGERQQRRAMERALRESEERFRNIVEHSQDWIWEMTADGIHSYSNRAVERLLGYPVAGMLGKDALAHMLQEDRERVRAQLPELMARKAGWTGWRLRWCARDGRTRTFESTATPLLDDAGALVGYRGIDHDITDLLEQQERIRQLARLHAILGGVGNSLLRIRDRERLLDDLCRVAVHDGGYAAAAIGLPVASEQVPGALAIANCRGDQRILECLRKLDLLEPDVQAARPGVRALQGGDPLFVRDLEGEDGAQLPEAVRAPCLEADICSLAVLPLGDPPWGVLGLYSREPQAFDDNERALLERLRMEIAFGVDFIAKTEQLEYLAYHNPVSGLPNRQALHLRLQVWLEHDPAALAMLDIERFAVINESRGRDFGDRLLRMVGERLKALAGSANHVSHPEGNTFVLVYGAPGTAEAELARLGTLVQELERDPFEIDGEQIRISLRSGLAITPEHGEQPETLEHSAAAALAEAKKRELPLFCFNGDLRGRAVRRLALEHDLRHAIEHEEFELFYQPKFDAASRRLVGAEALLRWRHPQRGLVSPGEFIPVLEQNALIVPVGRWVMAEALRTALAWRRHRPGLRIAVNVSARELRQVDFLTEVRGLLQAYVDDQPIDIELTESLLMDDIDNSMHLLDSLRDLGCRLAIDDFGTGYSSLNYLARLPVDTIKIDRSFIAVLTESPETMALVTNIINLVHSLSLDVVAEGVEEEGQAHLLRLLRCDVLQGYLLGRPMPEADFAARLLGESAVAADCT